MQSMNDFKARNLAKLILFAEQLEQGACLQITKLMPIFRLADSPEVMSKFMCYLLNKNYQHLLAGESLNTKIVMPLDKKIDLYRHLTEVVNEQIDFKKTGRNQMAAITAFTTRLGGTKRLSIHASRRALHDPDLLLVEYFCRGHLEKRLTRYLMYVLAQVYCCSYENFRFKPDIHSAPRVRDIINFFTALGDVECTTQI